MGLIILTFFDQRTDKVKFILISGVKDTEGIVLRYNIFIKIKELIVNGSWNYNSSEPG